MTSEPTMDDFVDMAQHVLPEGERTTEGDATTYTWVDLAEVLAGFIAESSRQMVKAMDRTAVLVRQELRAIGLVPPPPPSRSHLFRRNSRYRKTPWVKVDRWMRL